MNTENEIPDFTEDCVKFLHMCGISDIKDLPRMDSCPLEMDASTLLWILQSSKSFTRRVALAEAEGGVSLINTGTRHTVLESLKLSPRLFDDLVTLPHLAYESLLSTISLRAILLAANNIDWTVVTPRNRPKRVTAHSYLGVRGVRVSEQSCGTVVEVTDADTFAQIWIKLRRRYGQNLEVHGTLMQYAVNLRMNGISRLCGTTRNEFSDDSSFYTTLDWTAAAMRGSKQHADKYSSLIIFTPLKNEDVEDVYRFGNGAGHERLCRELVFGNYQARLDFLPQRLAQASIIEGRISLNPFLANSPEQILFTKSVQRCYATDSVCKELSARMLNVIFDLKFQVPEATFDFQVPEATPVHQV